MILIPDTFHFLRPWWLLALPLVLLPLRALGTGHGGWEAWRGVCDPHLLPHVIQHEGSESRGIWSRALLVAAWLLAVTALAGPAWKRLPEPLFRNQDAVMVVLDLSRSMRAADVAPSRLIRARQKVEDLLERTKGSQVGLVVFSVDAFVVAPLTDDHDTLSNLLPALDSEIMPAQGSRPDVGLLRAGEVLERAGVRQGRVILITDGAADPELLQRAARHMADAGHQLAILGVGTATGAPIPLAEGGFLTGYDGKLLLPRLEEEPLRQAAEAGRGRYVTLTPDDRDLSLLLQGDRPAPRATKAVQRLGENWREEGPWLLLLLVPLASLAFRRGWLAVLVLLLMPLRPAQALEWADLWQRPDQQGQAALAAGQPQEAARRFAHPGWQGVAHYRAGAYAEADAAFARQGGDEARYNQGNALVGEGRFQEAITAYDEVLARHPDHADARYNRDLLKQLLDQKPPDSSPQQDKQDKQGKQGKQGQQGASGGKSQQDQGQGDSQQGQGEENEQSSAADAKAGQEQGQGQGKGERGGGGGTPREGQGGEGGEEKARASDPAGAGEEQGDQGAEGRAAQAGGEGKDDKAKGAQAQGEQVKAAGLDKTPQAPQPELDAETEQALRQWLRRVPDDPGGLLRRKFQMDYVRRGKTGEGVEPW